MHMNRGCIKRNIIFKRAAKSDTIDFLFSNRKHSQKETEKPLWTVPSRDCLSSVNRCGVQSTQRPQYMHALGVPLTKAVKTYYRTNKQKKKPKQINHSSEIYEEWLL